MNSAFGTRPFRDEEISDNYNKILTGDTEGILAYWKFNEEGGANVVDTSNSNNHGTVVGTPTWLASQIPAAGVVMLDDPATIDSDGDGFTDAEEIAADSDPEDFDSTPVTLHPPGGVGEGLRFWLDASYLIWQKVIPSLNGLNSQVRVLSFTTSHTAPKYLTHGIDGMAAVEFKLNTTLSSPPVDFGLVNDFTIFLVKNDDTHKNYSNTTYAHFTAENNEAIRIYRHGNYGDRNEKFIVKASGAYTTDYISAGAPTITQGQTYTTTYVRTGTSLKLYCDGALVATDTGSAGPLQPYDSTKTACRTAKPNPRRQSQWAYF